VITLTQANDFTGAVNLNNTGANAVAVTDANALTLSTLSIAAGSLTALSTGALNLGQGTVGGSLAATSNGGDISQTGGLTMGASTFNAGAGLVTMTAGLGGAAQNSFSGAVTLAAGNADFYVAAGSTGVDRLAQTAGSTVVTGTFTLRSPTGTDFNLANGAGGFELTTSQLNNFNVGTLAPTVSGAGNISIGTFNFSGVRNLSLTTAGTGNFTSNGAITVQTLSMTTGSGDITANGAIAVQTLSMTTGSGDITANSAITAQTMNLDSGGSATLAVPNYIQNLGQTRVSAGGLTLKNAQGMNLTGAVVLSNGGSANFEVAGQLVNNTGSSTPFAGTTGSTTLRMLSPFVGGSLSLNPAGFSGFTPGYYGVNPGARNSIIYSVSPLTMFAPSGTVIAGVDLSGTQTGGGQLNTFLTGSDDLNWIISDFGKFNLPKVSSAGLEYTIYPKRVEPETRTLPDSTLSQLRQELGRPPTMDEINRREVSLRQSDRLRSGSILERSSLDSSEEPVENAKAATPSPIEGQIPQANQEPKKATSPDNRSSEPLPPVAASQVLPDDSFQPNADQRAAVSELLVKERANAEVGLAIPVARSK
jgi:hypothetical protein